MRAKEEECSKLAMERDLLATELAEQKELLVKSQREAEETETALLAEFASEHSSLSDQEERSLANSARRAVSVSSASLCVFTSSSFCSAN